MVMPTSRLSVVSVEFNQHQDLVIRQLQHGTGELTLTKSQREKLRMLFGGRCAYCGCELSEKGWHADHVEPIYRKIDRINGKMVATGECFNPENDTPENLVPACAPCNLFKSVYSVEVFREEIKKQAERARKSSVNFRTAERFGLIELVDKPVVFWFEKHQQES